MVLSYSRESCPLSLADQLNNGTLTHSTWDGNQKGDWLKKKKRQHDDSTCVSSLRHAAKAPFTVIYSRKFRGRVCGDPSFLKLVASIIYLPLSRRRGSEGRRATNNQHFPISVNLARSFNGKRRRYDSRLFRESETDMSILGGRVNQGNGVTRGANGTRETVAGWWSRSSL